MAELKWVEFKFKWEALTAIALCMLVFLTAIGLGINAMATMAALQLTDKEGQYQRGRLSAQTNAHQFIRYRVSPDMAKQYIKWLVRKVEKD